MSMQAGKLVVEGDHSYYSQFNVVISNHQPLICNA